MTLDLYIDLRSQTLIQSHMNGGKFVVPRQYREQLIPLRMFYVSPNATGGVANPYTLEDSSAYTSVRVGIGGFDNPLAVSSAMTWNSAIIGWEGGTLDLNTVEMSDAVDAASGGELSQIFETEAFNSGSLIKTQDSVVVKRTVLTSSGGLPNPVSNTNFANILELILADSDTVDVERTGNEFQFHVRRKALGGIGADVDGIYTERIGDAPAILSELATGFATTAPSGPGFSVTPSDDSVTATVGGVAGQCYKIKARVVGQVERKSISGGIQTPGDNALAYRGGTPAANNFNLWYLEISNPAQIIYLNRIAGAEGQPYTVGADYFVDFLAYAGATVTLAFDTFDGLSYLANNLVVTQEMAEEVSSCSESVAAHASTHQNNGADEISVAGLSGLLADGQTALAHASTHASAGSDPLTLAQSQVTSLTSDLAAKLALAGGTMTGQLNFSGTTHAGLKLLSLTTVQRDALTAANGMLIYNTTLSEVQKYSGGAWGTITTLSVYDENGSVGTAPVASGGIASVAIGNGAKASQNYALGFGRNADASGLQSGVFAGTSGTATGENSAAIGGLANVASGEGSAAIGGGSNAASAKASVAFGSTAVADIAGQIAVGNDALGGSGLSQCTAAIPFSLLTTDATPTELVSLAAGRLALRANTLWHFSIRVVARRAGGAGHAAWKVEGAIYRNATVGSTVVFGDVESSPNSANEAGWDFTVSADTTNGALKMLATGGAYNVRWTAAVQLSEITYA